MTENSFNFESSKNLGQSFWEVLTGYTCCVVNFNKTHDIFKCKSKKQNKLLL